MSDLWPPGPDDTQLLEDLAHLLATAGAARFLDAAVVAADPHAFPEPWRPTRAAVERLLARLCWHAHVDLDLVVEDVRAPAAPEHAMLRTIAGELRHADERLAREEELDDQARDRA